MAAALGGDIHESADRYFKKAGSGKVGVLVLDHQEFCIDVETDSVSFNYWAR
jgi:hypothetical protein